MGIGEHLEGMKAHWALSFAFLDYFKKVAICGAVVGSEVAEHWYQLYKADKQGANLRFIYWWEDKVAGMFFVRLL
ncbi:hypothetical protein E2562_035309 [Oryza meyeriana var. granulata]|uniref:Uncharacterized protein n=1 Tax=Oryza meyeriana var. granulata TaxID=110450 RepID=A0A6G1CKW3_9ORYZ|nr:hypothetical protein E2562_035309 [Oryza meyeriana var. granulata]